VARLAEVKAPRQPQLAEVADRVRQDVEQERLRELSIARLQPAKARLDGGASLEEVAAELGLEVAESEEFGAGQIVPGLGIAPEVVKQALASPEGTLGGPVAIPGRALLYRVVGRKSGDPATAQQVKQGIRDQLEREQIDALLGSLINARKQELGVTYDPALLEQAGITGGEAEQG
jgi:peptidyl-prolyl cis-trans isomerase D